MLPTILFLTILNTALSIFVAALTAFVTWPTAYKLILTWRRTIEHLPVAAHDALNTPPPTP